MNPLAKLRDWWHRPVTDRLDRIEIQQSAQHYRVGMNGTDQAAAESREALERLNRASKVDRRRT